MAASYFSLSGLVFMLTKIPLLTGPSQVHLIVADTRAKTILLHELLGNYNGRLNARSKLDALYEFCLKCLSKIKVMKKMVTMQGPVTGVFRVT